MWIEIAVAYAVNNIFGSLPAGGVWIEIKDLYKLCCERGRHSPNGECGLTYLVFYPLSLRLCHSPHGECGLKSLCLQSVVYLPSSLPAWGVWIEIVDEYILNNFYNVTPRMGSVD